jgi:hypothetical protein
MSEKIYALLFRLFPARFRAAWGEEAIDLYRQRARDERGFRSRMRLWRDLLADLAVSLPGTYLREEPGLAPAREIGGGAVPSFTMLEEKPIRGSAYFYGTLLTLAILGGISVLAKHAGHFPVLRASNAAEASGVTMDPWAIGHGSGGGGGDTAVLGKGPGATPAAEASTGKAATKYVSIAEGKPLTLFDDAERKRVVEGIAATLRRDYPDHASAEKVARTVQANERDGGYDAVDDPAAFATLLTRQLRTASGDSHFDVVYSAAPMHESAPPTAAQEAQYRAVALGANCGFEEVKILPGRIGYLKLDTFSDPRVCGGIAIAAMKKLSASDGLIIDLRDNSGGSPEMVLFLGGWLFDKPAYFWNPREDSAANMWTHSPMAGSALEHKPVWVLTSGRTWSAAEHFSYDLKELHRATLVGETTGGATDVGVFHRIDEHFGIGMRESRVANPYPDPDWAGRGVQPDVRVPADGALAMAEGMAQKQLARR